MMQANKNNFEDEVLKSELPVVVDFWAEWCGPCVSLGPIFEETAKDYSGKTVFAKVNVDEENELAGKYEVKGIPCIIIFSKGREIGRITGFIKKEHLKAEIDEMLKKA